jgi:hypothetical protein
VPELRFKRARARPRPRFALERANTILGTEADLGHVLLQRHPFLPATIKDR